MLKHLWQGKFLVKSNTTPITTVPEPTTEKTTIPGPTEGEDDTTTTSTTTKTIIEGE